MSTVLTVGADADLVAALRAAADGDVLALGTEVVTAGTLLGHLAGPAAPVLLVLGADVPLGTAFALAEQVDVVAPATSVAVVAIADADLWLHAMRAGIRDVLSPRATAADVAAVLSRATGLAQARRAAVAPEPDAAPAHRVLVVASPKGGVGKTTVATNLAIGLAAAEPGSTVLVDLDLQFGDVTSALALTPQFTLPDTVHGARNDPLVLKTFLSRHRSGLHVVAGSDSPAAADGVAPADVARLLDMLAREFRYVVVDTAPGLSEHTLTALERATDLVLISSMDVPGIRGLRKEMDVLAAVDLLPPGRHLVLNCAAKSAGLDLADVERTLGGPVDLVLPRHAAVVTSTNTGVTLLEGDGRDPVTRGLQRLVARVAPQSVLGLGRRARRKAGAR